MTTTLADHAVEILQRTHDGDNLDPSHLKLVELAVNGCLNDAGKGAFTAFLANVRDGYTKPWFHGVEHITHNHAGDVLWKGRPIEHVSSGYAHGDEAKTYTQELARRCLILEKRAITPGTLHVVWNWPPPA